MPDVRSKILAFIKKSFNFDMHFLILNKHVV